MTTYPATIRWWGGWAEGEHRDTLIRYLLDKLHYYEDGHGNALCPIPTENHLSFMGKHREIQPVTLADMKTIFTSIEGMIMAGVTSAITNLLQEDSHLSDILNILQTQISNKSIEPSQSIIRQGEHSPSHLSNAHTVHPTTPIIKSPSSANIPPGLYLPNLPNIASEDRWKYFGDECCIALKDWEDSWIKHPDFANKYFQQKSVALEFERCAQDENLFLECWPDAKKGITPLLTAIRQKQVA
ncbi:hypothetical protein Clacol_004756 [Clathrus columnatus]|uniref:Uncharacterized protein n=1 Tax=Clathrus columnatus TaxID=1419009 RepID=A0AAV5A8B4_9AGAM|nr:hypothetical protein Clacol_004756 [Clathrus columnatus]